MEILRTPEDRFADLADFPYDPRYTDVASGEGDATLRVAHVEDGPDDGPVVLMLHGEPSWSFLYRKMIPRLAAEGLRAVAPDLVGFGRSDKPAAVGDYTYARHVAWMTSWLAANDSSGVTLFCQDWGGLIGLRLVGEHPERFSRVVAANTFLPTGDIPIGDAFLAWQRYSQEAPSIPIGAIVNAGCVSELPPETIAAYDAPFPTEAHKAGARAFPLLVPTQPDDPAAAANRAAWEVLREWKRPFLTAFGDSDPITHGADRRLQEAIPGCAGMKHTTVEGAGHFCQEDRGEEYARIVADLVAATP